MYCYTVTWVLEAMNITNWITTDEPTDYADVAQLSRQAILDSYKIDPETLHWQQVLVEEAI
jgi:hypothetical protein